ncbi:MAG: hypothetical protein GC171_11225 [Terrimonas sp.]|nr:hypothetical protein [Terrimonas sp.]
MINKNSIQDEINRTLESLDGAERARANPFLFTRIQAKMNREKSVWSMLLGTISRPAFAFAIIAFILLANIWTLYQGNNRTDSANSAFQAATAADLPEEYNLAVNTFYDYETP